MTLIKDKIKAQENRELLKNPKVQAILRTIRYAEGADYNTRVGGGTFSDLSKKPGKKIYIPSIKDYSTAEGAYQFLNGTWEGVANKLGLKDFSPESQDIAAVELIKQRGALDDVLSDKFDSAIAKLSPEWASLPTKSGNSYYGNQKARNLNTLKEVYGGNDASYTNSVAPYMNQAPIITPDFTNLQFPEETPTLAQETEEEESPEVVQAKQKIATQTAEKQFLIDYFSQPKQTQEVVYEEPQQVEPYRDITEQYNEASQFIDNPIMQQGGKFEKNNLINRVFNRSNILEAQILEENKALKNIAPLRKFHVDYANKEDSKTMSELGHNPEYISPNEGLYNEVNDGISINKGKMLVNNNPNNPKFVNVNYPNHYTTLINKEGLTPIDIKNLASNDFTSHALHGDSNYDNLSKELETALLSKYPEDMIKNNGGVDAYIRGILSNDESYSPYKNEMMGVVPQELGDKITNYVRKGIFQQGGNISQFLKKPIVPRDEKNIIQRDNTNVKKQQLRPIQQLNVRNKTDKEIAQEREAKIQASMLAQKTPYTQENWREQLAAETAAIGDKLRFSNEPNAIDDSMFNPVQMIAGMASNLGQAPLQAKQTNSNLPYLTSIGAPLAVGAIGGLGTKTTGQFVNNLVNPLAGSERVIKYNKLYNLLPNELNPNLLNAKNGENWIKEWYSNPETKIKASAYEELNPGQSFMDLSGEDKINLAISDLSLYKDKNYIDILKDKGLNKYIKHTLNSQGVSYGVPDEIYTKSQALYGLNKVGRESTKVHELTHLAENNGNILNTKESDALLEPFGYSTKEVYNSNKTPLEVLGSRDKTYYLTPTEIHARMNEARYNLGLKPQDLFTENDYETIKNGVDWFGMGKYIKDKDKFIKLMNNFYTIAPIAGASYLATQEQSKLQQGGNIVDNFRAEHPSVRDLRTDLLNKKIQEHYGKNTPTNTIQKDNIITVKPKVGNIATQKEINQRAEKENKTAYENSTKQANKDYVEKNMGEVYQHPLWSLPGTVTPEGVAVIAMQGAAKITPDLYNKDYKSAGMDALMMLPLAPGAVKAISPIAQNVIGSADEMVNSLGNKYLTNAYKLNPLAGKLNRYNRIVGEDAVNDLVESGLVRTPQSLKKELPTGSISLDRKGTTPYPSFGEGVPNIAENTYAQNIVNSGKTPYIISTDNSMGLSTLGRHGKGSTLFPIDESGKYLESFPANKASVFEANPHWLQGYKQVEVPKQQQGGATSDTIRIDDTRKVRATTNKPINPNVDLVTGDYRSKIIEDIVNAALKNGVDPDTALALAMQESKLGNTDENLGHIVGGSYRGEEANDMTKLLSDKIYQGRKLGKNTDEQLLQMYNGTGKVFPNTEQDYHGFKMKQVYGVPIPKEGIDMSKNPLYGKQIIDIRDNVIKKNKVVASTIKNLKNNFNHFEGTPYKKLLPIGEELFQANAFSNVNPKYFQQGGAYTENEQKFINDYFQQGGQIPCLECGGHVEVSNLTHYKTGGFIQDNRGQWAHPGKNTEIASPNITMKGVNYPVLGISKETGEEKLMMPNQDYYFDNTKSVLEIPYMQEAGKVNSPFGVPKSFLEMINPAYVKLANNRIPKKEIPQSLFKNPPTTAEYLLKLQAQANAISKQEQERAQKIDPRLLHIKPIDERGEALVKKDGVQAYFNNPSLDIEGLQAATKGVDVEEIRKNLQLDKNKEIQNELINLGYDIGSKTGEADGIIGKKTLAALAEFKKTGKAPKNISLVGEELLARRAKNKVSAADNISNRVGDNLSEYLLNPLKTAASNVLPNVLGYDPKLSTVGTYDDTKGANRYLLDNNSIEDIRKEKNISFGQISQKRLKGNTLLPLKLKNKIVNATNPQGYMPDVDLEDNFINRLMDDKSNTAQVKRLEGKEGDFREDIYRMYAGLPQKFDTFTASSFKAGKNSDTNLTFKNPDDVADYVKIAAAKTDLFKKLASGEITPETIKRDKESGKKGGDKINKASFRDPKNVMWNATMGVDFDKSGNPYLSFYDNWDLAVKDDYSATKAAFGSPVEIYDRIPLTKELVAEMAKIQLNVDSDAPSDALDDGANSDKKADSSMAQIEKELEKNPTLKKEYAKVLNSIRSRYKK